LYPELQRLAADNARLQSELEALREEQTRLHRELDKGLGRVQRADQEAMDRVLVVMEERDRLARALRENHEELQRLRQQAHSPRGLAERSAAPQQLLPLVPGTSRCVFLKALPRILLTAG
jgi:hypothetical protein